MFRRKAYDDLVNWKKTSNGSSVMLIEGARRVGKSMLAEEFARNEYASYVLVDFTKVTEEFKQTFLDTRGDLDSFSYIFSLATAWLSRSASPLSSSVRFSCFPK